MRTNLVVFLIFVQVDQIYNRPSLPPSPTPAHDKTAKNHDTIIVPSHDRKKKGFTLPFSPFLAGNLHVVPLQHVYTPHEQNATLVPVYAYIPIHRNYLVPVHELSVLPLRRAGDDGAGDAYAHLQWQQQWPLARGGHGTGLHWGGRGAGHGYYVIGYKR